MEGVAPHVVDLLELLIGHEVDIVSGEGDLFIVILKQLVADIVFDDVGV